MPSSYCHPHRSRVKGAWARSPVCQCSLVCQCLHFGFEAPLSLDGQGEHRAALSIHHLHPTVTVCVTLSLWGAISVVSPRHFQPGTGGSVLGVSCCLFWISQIAQHPRLVCLGGKLLPACHGFSTSSTLSTNNPMWKCRIKYTTRPIGMKKTGGRDHTGMSRVQIPCNPPDWGSWVRTGFRVTLKGSHSPGGG